VTAPLAVVFGCSGPGLTDEERALFAAVQPFGFILFARNIKTRDQVHDLVDDLRSISSSERVPVLIDQEGGRVARLRGPQWRAAPAARRIGELAAVDPAAAVEAARLNGRLLAAELEPLGIDVDCVPVLDLPAEGAHDVIGDRAFGDDPAMVARLGRATAEGLAAGGVMPVMKHMPGHGQARSDSHLALPVVDASAGALEGRDFAPFRALADLPAGMTAHLVYTAFDPARPATLSPVVIGEVIRGRIGFGGLLLSDDLGMSALSGTLPERAAAAVAAGCDAVLHCNGSVAEMAAVAKAVPPASAAALARLDRARAWVAARRAPLPAGARARFDALMAAAAV